MQNMNEAFRSLVINETGVTTHANFVPVLDQVQCHEDVSVI